MSRPRELSNSSWTSTSSQDSPYSQPAYYSPSPALCPPGQQHVTTYAYLPSPDPSPVLNQEEAFYPAATYRDNDMPAPRFAPQAPQAAYMYSPTSDPSSSSSFAYSHGYPSSQHHDTQPLQYPPSAYRQLPPLPQAQQQRAIPPLMRHQPPPPSRGPSPPAHQYYTTERTEQGWTPAMDRPSPYDRQHQHDSSPYYARPPAEYQHRGMVAPAIYTHEYRNDSYPLPLLPVPPAPLSYDQRSISEGSPRGSEGSFGSDEDRHEAITPFVSKLAHLLNHSEYSEVIRWNREGTAFTFAHGSAELLTVFSRFFRHSNVHSFVRQLNIYSFTRLSTIDLLDALEGSAPSPNTEFSGFFHPLLFRDSPGHICDLSKIKPKASKKKPSIQKLNAHLAPEVRKRSIKVEGKTGGGMKHRKL